MLCVRGWEMAAQNYALPYIADYVRLCHCVTWDCEGNTSSELFTSLNLLSYNIKLKTTFAPLRRIKKKENVEKQGGKEWES